MYSSIQFLRESREVILFLYRFAEEKHVTWSDDMTYWKLHWQGEGLNLKQLNLGAYAPIQNHVAWILITSIYAESLV